MAREKTFVKLNRKKVYSFMLKNGLQTSTLAPKADITFKTLCRALNSKDIQLKTAYKIAEVLGVAVEYLIEKDDCDLLKDEDLAADKEKDLAAKEKALADKERKLAKLEKDLACWQNFLLAKDRLLLDKKKDFDANAKDLEAKAKIFDAIMRVVTKFGTDLQG